MHTMVLWLKRGSHQFQFVKNSRWFQNPFRVGFHRDFRCNFRIRNARIASILRYHDCNAPTAHESPPTLEDRLIIFGLHDYCQIIALLILETSVEAT